MKGDKDEDPLPIVKYSDGSISCGIEGTGAQIFVIIEQQYFSIVPLIYLFFQ